MIPALTLIEDQMSFYNVRRSGSSYDAATLIAATIDIGSTECVAYLPKGLEDTQTIWTIDQNVYIPDNISVLIPCGVILQVNVGMQITFGGPMFNQCPVWRMGLGQVVLQQKTAINSQSYRDFFDPFVVSGGIHGLSPTCFSPNFGTEAYVANGQYVREESMSINYGALGANCLEDWVWVIISNFNVPTIPGTNFTQVPGTHYYIDFTSTTRPSLPLDSAYLMELHLQGDQIVQVNDLRSLDAAQGLLNRIPWKTWTPTLTPGSYVYSAQNGTYINLGPVVYVIGNLTVSTINSYGTGMLEIAGLPYDYSVVQQVYAGGLTLHVASKIKSLYGPGAFSGSLTSTGRSFAIIESVSSIPAALVSADRVMPGMQLAFTGIYVLAGS